MLPDRMLPSPLTVPLLLCAVDALESEHKESNRSVLAFIEVRHRSLGGKSLAESCAPCPASLPSFPPSFLPSFHCFRL